MIRILRNTFFSLSLTVIWLQASAISALQGQWKTLTLTDGTLVRAVLVGDEAGHWWQSIDGTCYALQDSSGLYIQLWPEEIEEKRYSRKVLSSTNQQRSFTTTDAKASIYTGQKRCLLLLVYFTDKNFLDTDSLTTNQLYNRIANEEGLVSEEGFTRSIRDYFVEQSEGQFEPIFDVVGPYRMKNRSKFYGQNSSSTGGDKYLCTLIASTCEAADNDVDFSQYDWDGDGQVDQVVVVYAGQGEAAGGGEDTIWPQEGKLSAVGSDHSPITLDGVTIDTYACTCELGVNNTIDGIGTLCHEFAHCLGLPDFYDTAAGSAFSTGTNYGTYVWDTMAMGNYLDSSFTPAGFTSYERWFCGWKIPIELSRDTIITNMKPLSEGGDTYIIYNEADCNEYYLLENRRKTGTDAGLMGEGLLVLYVNYNEEAWEANTLNARNTERLTVIPADNSKAMTVDLTQDTSNDEVAGDAYPYKDNNSLTNYTTPSATLNNKNSDGTYFLNKQITDITLNEDGTVNFNFIASAGIDGVTSIQNNGNVDCDEAYFLDGRKAGSSNRSMKQILIKNGRKSIKYVNTH